MESLPPELLQLVFGHCSSNDLAQILRLNRTFHAVAIQVLYQSIPRLDVVRSTECLTSLCFSPTNAALVKSLAIHWETIFLKDPISHRGTLQTITHFGTFNALLRRRILNDRFALLHNALKRLRNLTHLTLIVSPRDSRSDAYVPAILNKVVFQLTSFKTSFIFGRDLAAFLERQPKIEALVLAAHSRFELESPCKPSICPQLRSLSWAWGDQHDQITALLRGRPVKNASVVLSSQNVEDTVKMLGVVDCPLESVELTVRDLAPTRNIIPLVLTNLPKLQQLRLSIPSLPSEVSATLRRFCPDADE
ncbi:hypothetical protein HGRIS_010973 [Hohenbuehelia grisea]|uniref:F-box domain-containing protein n=1 Tax=Hohenbuehelia grisea TaxID=104357 RepID=A0ABR3IYE5_9AGAR